ncbi:MAG: class I SAM-dependent methyltransferase family protein [Archaeoglobaceae archaeon]
MRAVKVPKEQAEKVRRYAEEIKAKDKKRLVIQKDDFVEIPIYDEYASIFDHEVIEQESPLFAKEYDLAKILRRETPPELHSFIPHKYKIVGDIIMIKIPPQLKEYKKKVGEVLLSIHPRCKSVWEDKGKKGMLRRPEVELISGEGSETVHREGGCYYKLDVTQVMFSPGNLAERTRAGQIVKEGELVVDMFAGIGYFSIPAAVHGRPKRIYSIEANPQSYTYLLENIQLNKAHRIVPILGDSMFITPQGVADRVFMGHINSQDFLSMAVRALKEKGFIHYHESTPEAVLDRPVERVKRAAEKEGKKAKIEDLRKVKHYSPGVLHVVLDVYIS